MELKQSCGSNFYGTLRALRHNSGVRYTALHGMLRHVSRARSNYASCRLPYACLSIPAPVIARGRSVSIHFIDLTAASAGRATFYFFS